jgi:hypothetical protein
MKNVWRIGLLLAVLSPVPAAADQLVAFEGGIGVVPVRAGGLATTVRGVNPGGQPWVIAKLDAVVQDDGRIKVDGRGLLLAGGDNIGTGGGQTVGATLFCVNDGNVEHKTATADAVLLEPDGDFQIVSVLTPPPPVPCENPVLLIRGTAGDGNWFAAGIPKGSQ